MLRTNLNPPQLTTEEIARFWLKVSPVGDALECWPWIAGTNRRGYGVFHIRQNGFRSLFAHRIAFFLIMGEWPEVVRHWCDNPPCCNPLHGRPGTQTDNMRDAVERKRMASGDNHGLRKHPDRASRGKQHYSHLYPERVARGETAGGAKLTEADVRAIRLEVLTGKPQTKIAADHSVTQTLISMIKLRKIWKHVA